MLVWNDTATAENVEEVSVFKDYNALIKKIGYYSDGWYKGLNNHVYWSTQTIVDEWNKTHSRKITSVYMNYKTKSQEKDFFA